jgi:coproporphyrinogen III oxidase
MSEEVGIEARAAAYFTALQDRICAALEAVEASAGSTSRFREDAWSRPGGGGGRSRVLEGGRLFEKGGVNFSLVHGELKSDFAATMPGDGLAFVATGVSLVLHPRSPRVPTVHANFRCLRRGQSAWFGGGADLTPYYPVRSDVLHFHSAWKRACDAHDPTRYARYKKWCDEYFFLPHRGETRGVGGIFFDHLHEALEPDFAFVRACGDAFVDAYLPIVEARKDDAYGERERAFQLMRRGRYVEFNLLYDRGTLFGLKTDGRVESILMSLPPEVRWVYDPHFAEGSEEAELASWLRPQDWLGVAAP